MSITAIRRLRGSNVQFDAQNQIGLTNDMRRQNRFVPGLITKIQQSVMPISLIFNNNCLVLNNGTQKIEYEDGRFLSGSFLRAGIKEITLKELPSRSEIDEIKSLLESAQTGSIGALLPQNLARLRGIEVVKEIEMPDSGVEQIEGSYKHYTSYLGYCEIMHSEKKVIQARPHRKNGEERLGVYLTGLSLSPGEAFNMIFIGNLEYSDRSAYVIGFDIVDPGLKAQVQQTGIEFFIGGKINLDDPRIKVRYHGPNFMKAVA